MEPSEVFGLVEKHARVFMDQLIAESTDEAGAFDGADFQTRLAAALETMRGADGV